MKKKKIAFVVAIAGTAQAFLKDHMSYLVEEYDVHLVANFKDGEKVEFEDMGVVCHDAPIQRSIKIFSDLKALWCLFRIFKDQKFDSVHSATPKAGLLTSIAGWLAGVPHRIHIFTGQVWATRTGAMRLMLKTLDKVIALFDTNILVDGEGQRQFLIKEGILKESNSVVLANGSIAGVKLERFVISEDVRRAERDKFGFADDDVVYAYMGRLNHDKGIGELFDAFNKLSANHTKAKLLFYGTDEEGYDTRADMYPYIKRNVNYFYPGITRCPFNALQVADVFVLPTWREGFGMSVIEAQALALPVITSDAYGVVDASVEGVTGLRCKVNDPDGLKSCMELYYNDVAMRKTHGTAGRRRIEEKFNNAIVSQAWWDYYRKILN